MREARGEMVRFALAGVVGLLTDVLVLYLALALGLGLFAGRAVSFLAAVWVTFQLNRRVTFGAGAGGPVWRAWWRYLAAMLVGGIVNYAVYSGVVVMFSFPFLPLVAVAAGSLAGMALNFVSAKFFVFSR